MNLPQNIQSIAEHVICQQYGECQQSESLIGRLKSCTKSGMSALNTVHPEEVSYLSTPGPD